MVLSPSLTREEILREHPDLQPPDTWKYQLILSPNGKPTSCVSNVLAALRLSPELKKAIAHDEFGNRPMLIRQPPWDKKYNGEREWRSDDDIKLQAWLQDNGLIVGQKSTVVDAVQVVAREHEYHPVRNYLDTIIWDQRQRLDGLLPHYFGADDSPYVRAVGAKFLISAVARTYRPGCKVDNVLMLEGPQNLGKSTAVAVLADPWQCEHIPDLHSKDAMQQIQGVLMVELAELSAMRKSDVESTKAFISRQVDRYRAPYADYPRQCVFVGTTNSDTYLSDITGNRRFWPVRCTSINLRELKRDKEQLWAEAVDRFDLGEQWWLTPEQEDLAENEQEVRRIAHPWETPVGEFLDACPDSVIYLRDILSNVLEIEAGRHNVAQARLVSDIVQRHGWIKQRRTQVRGRKEQPFVRDR